MRSRQERNGNGKTNKRTYNFSQQQICSDHSPARGALMIRVGLSGPLRHIRNEEPSGKILVKNLGFKGPGFTGLRV